MKSQDETGCETPEAPILCVNNCGFFGSATTMNMCSKCYKEMILKQQQAQLAASSIESIVNASSSEKSVITGVIDAHVSTVKAKTVSVEPSNSNGRPSQVNVKESPSRCSTCRKRVGLTGFSCKCGNLFCALHRYSDKHECPFDYHTAAQDVIAKANPVVKAEKLDKI